MELIKSGSAHGVVAAWDHLACNPCRPLFVILYNSKNMVFVAPQISFCVKVCVKATNI